VSEANRGKAWEAVLDEWNARYRAEGRAVVHRTPPAIRVIGAKRGGLFRACFAGKGPPDYAGVIAGWEPSTLGTSRAVCFDAKDCAEPRWPYSKLEPHQAETFDAWVAAGGLAFVALRLRGRGWVLSWSLLGPLWHAYTAREGKAKSGEAGIDPLDHEGRALPMPTLGDWLGALP